MKVVAYRTRIEPGPKPRSSSRVTAVWITADIRDESREETIEFQASSGASPERFLPWIGGFALLVLVAVMTFILVSSLSSPPLSLDAARFSFAADPSIQPLEARPARTDCGEIAEGDLHSPAEGVWFQRNCLFGTQLPVDAPVDPTPVVCGRPSLDPSEFAAVAPGLFVYRQTEASTAYLWYATSEACFDLVSSRAVTVLCADQTVSFDWRKTACSAHGGVLLRVN